MNTTHQVRVPDIKNLDEMRLSTGHNHEAVVITTPKPVDLIVFTPMEARALGSRLLELADEVDGGRGEKELV